MDSRAPGCRIARGWQPALVGSARVTPISGISTKVRQGKEMSELNSPFKGTTLLMTVLGIVLGAAATNFISYLLNNQQSKLNAESRITSLEEQLEQLSQPTHTNRKLINQLRAHEPSNPETASR